MKFRVGQVGGIFGEGEEGELAEFESLGWRQGWERGVASVVDISAVAEDFQKGEI